MVINMCEYNNVPKIRFKGFTDVWEQRKLGELYNFRYGDGNNNPSNGGKYDVYGANGIIGGYDKFNSENSIIIGHMGEYAGSVLWGEGKHFVTYNGTITRPKRNNIDDKFGYYMLYRKELNKICGGSGLPFLSYQELNKVEVDYSKNKDEQIKISKLLTDLDNLITLHQRKFNDIIVYKLSTKFLFLKLAKNVWEQRKLSELCNIYDGTHQTPNYKDSGIMFLSVENIKDLSSNKYISYKDFKKNFKVYPEKNDILMTRIGDIGTTNIVKENSLKAYYVSLALLKCKSINPYYLNFAIKSDYVQKGLKLRSLLTAIPMKINKDQIGEVDINYPIDSEEQSNIGKLFDNLDNLITLHHRKYTYIFYSWEQRKLGEISSIVGGGTPSTEVESYWNGNINWYSPAEIGSQIYVSNSQRKITELGLEKSSARLLPVGTVLFTSRAGIGNMAILKEKACTNQGFQSIIPIQNKLNSYFIFSRSNELKKYAETVGSGSTFVEVSGKQMSEMEIKIPQIKEQVKIADLFTNLDNLITLHQHKELKRRNDNNEHLRW